MQMAKCDLEVATYHRLVCFVSPAQPRRVRVWGNLIFGVSFIAHKFAQPFLPGTVKFCLVT